MLKLTNLKQYYNYTRRHKPSLQTLRKLIETHQNCIKGRLSAWTDELSIENHFSFLNMVCRAVLLLIRFSPVFFIFGAFFSPTRFRTTDF